VGQGWEGRVFLPYWLAQWWQDCGMDGMDGLTQAHRHDFALMTVMVLLIVLFMCVCIGCMGWLMRAPLNRVSATDRVTARLSD